MRVFKCSGVYVHTWIRSDCLIVFTYYALRVTFLDSVSFVSLWLCNKNVNSSYVGSSFVVTMAVRVTRVRNKRPHLLL